MGEPFVFVPVRHHSPACARLIQRLFAETNPSRVLIEGPSDFNDRLAELLLPHKLPIAIYSFVREGETRSGAYYPFCVYSPEWQAIQLAGGRGIPFSFIDLPWSEMSRGEEIPTVRSADSALRQSVLIDALCKNLGVEDFNALWDTLFEIEPEPADLLTRLHTFCTALRAADEEAGAVSDSDLAREAFMRSQMEEAQARWKPGDGPILVVTGGYHTAALVTQGSGEMPSAPQVDASESPGSSGIALTPYSYERLDALTGYASGMPSPGYYHAIWHGLEPLPMAVGALRARKQPVSTADLITAEAMAQGLAALRGHVRVWRSDLLDGARSALVKDSIEGDVHPLLAALLQAFRGGERGQLAEGTVLPPLAIEIQESLRQAELFPEAAARSVPLKLRKDDDQLRSRLLHRLVGLRVPGLTRTLGTDFAARDDVREPFEEWKLLWSPDFDGSCIEAALYGATIEEAAAARLLECASAADRDAEAAALLRLEAAQMGLELPLGPLVALLRAEGDFARLARALGHLLYLYRFDEAFGTAGNKALGELLEDAFQRGVWLLTTVTDGTKPTIDGVSRLVETWRRCREWLSGSGLIDALNAAAHDRERAPGLRGAAVGALWSLGSLDDDSLLALIGAFARPDHLGDFLTGLFTLAREAARSKPGLMLRLDELILALSDEDFLFALPSLRLAFSFFPPREKSLLARGLLEAKGDTGAMLPALAVSPEEAAEALAVESRIFALLEALR